MPIRPFWIRGAPFSCVLLLSGCLSGADAYLRLSQRYTEPKEYVDTRNFLMVTDAWSREGSLGLAGGILGLLEDPAVGAEIVSLDAQQSHAAGPPGTGSLAMWQILYGQGDRLPIHIRWRFDKHLYDPQVVDPASGWTFTLSDDLGYAYPPLYRGKLKLTPDPVAWVGSFTLWFGRRDLDGRLRFTSHTRSLRLHVTGNPGETTLTWRFLPLFARPAFGLYDQFDAPGAISHRPVFFGPSPTPEATASPGQP